MNIMFVGVINNLEEVLQDQWYLKVEPVVIQLRYGKSILEINMEKMRKDQKRERTKM